MARSTFDGPILSGSNRFGALRNVGYTDLCQETSIVLTNTTNGTAGYAGGSGQFVNGNGVPNTNAIVYTPSGTVYPPVAATITPDAVGGTNTTGTLYRGVVFYLPYGSNINDFLIDTNVVITLNSGTVGTVTAKIGNTFNDTTYGSITSVNAAAARNTIVQTGAQLLACNSSTADITQSPTQSSDPYAALVSQVVVTFTIPYTGGTAGVLSTLTAGTLTCALRYTQLDPNIGNATTYPYGNFD
jgi:hypothetical protein